MVVNYKATAAFPRVYANVPFSTDFYPYHVAPSQSVSLSRTAALFNKAITVLCLGVSAARTSSELSSTPSFQSIDQSRGHSKPLVTCHRASASSSRYATDLSGLWTSKREAIRLEQLSLPPAAWLSPVRYQA